MGCVRELVLALVFLGLNLCGLCVDGSSTKWDDLLRMPTYTKHGGGGNGGDGGGDDDGSGGGTRWAVLIAGSMGYGNYRHQADVCHAYHIMKNGGLKDENIVVFMYDDIANSSDNPRPGTIINHPRGKDVYAGVPKDYVGENVNEKNFFAVLLGDRSSVTGGSGKVVDSGQNDHIFIYYSDHGGPGVLGMPTPPYLFANDFVEVLKKKHAAGTYKEMLIYIEACESGSIFEGLLPEGLNIYSTTAANAEENSWGTYCPGMSSPPPKEYFTCLGDLYSVAWMEDSEMHNLETETIKQQYQLVKMRASDHNTYRTGSHVMQYGDIPISREHLFLYMGSDPENANATFTFDNGLQEIFDEKEARAINQRDADLLYLWQKYKRSTENSIEKLEAQKHLVDLMTHRMHLDKSVKLIGKLLFGTERGPLVLNTVRSPGQPLVDDWDCLKTMVRIFETHCGSLSQYGMKHMRSLANICNQGISNDVMSSVSAEACAQVPFNSWSSLHKDFSA
ncbi:hypothetical protein SUGI_0443330 [Cryptomeria japonica]|uniref:vacuolar-processing enzyme isoform X2 n=1 Tax=Cryptomeria japonica TaxID=3369 RepID=UPI002408DA52|nr:vacuolar-processing enzyme isoform X2 [Cryptomeria japonica]GLJ23425.1 hypothetical protein SUGI_0443330 [Cryptomeria japonica]